MEILTQGQRITGKVSWERGNVVTLLDFQNSNLRLTEETLKSVALLHSASGSGFPVTSTQLRVLLLADFGECHTGKEDDKATGILTWQE